MFPHKFYETGAKKMIFFIFTLLIRWYLVIREKRCFLS